MFYTIDANVSSTLTFTSHWWSMVDIFYKRSFPAYIIMTVQNWLFRASDMAKFQTEEIYISFLKTGNRASNKQTDYW